MNVPRRRRRGGMLIYITVGLLSLCALASLAVDFGRAQLVKTELQCATDAAARQAAANLQSGYTTATAKAMEVAAYNKANGTSVVLDANNDIEFGVWDTTTRTFTPLSGSARNSATAVRITAHRTAARGNAVPTAFARLLGIPTLDVKVTAIAARGTTTTYDVDADSCPWLAGMPNGSIVAGYDGNTTNATAPANSPKQFNIPLTAGNALYFRQTSGSTSYENASSYGPDGNTGWIVRQQPANGINATSAPLNCLVGIFLDNRAPNTWSQAAELDFSTGSSRDFTTLSPALKQVFFIGDGMTANSTLQKFIVPNGATRLYIGIMDEKGWWWDNTGSINTSVIDENIQLVN